MTAGEGPGRVVAGRYALRSLLGRGGMGSVWLASDEVLGRDVAVKEITFPISLTEQERRSLRERTLREARAAARFEHPQVTTVHDVVEQDGKPWIVMEHVPSRTLSDLVRDQGPLAVTEVARIGLDVLAALSAAHRAGIVHRDVKPANVLVGEQGHAWLTDFGIATSPGDEHLTGHGVLLGSPSYIAPERARGEEPGPAADLWGLGATLFTAVEGEPPFERGEPMATLLAIATEQAPTARRAGPLEPLLRALLEQDPAVRMTAEQARSRLTEALEGSVQPAPATAHRSDAAAQPDPDSAVRQRGRAPGGAGREDQVERIDLDELARRAAAATKAIASSAVRTAGRTAARSAARTVARGPQRRAAGRPSWRFKRRWVVVPLLVSFVLVVAVVDAAAWLLVSLLTAR